MQKGWIHYMLPLIGVALFTGAALALQREPAVAGILFVSSILFGLITFSFVHLLIEDRGDHLYVQFGPLGLFRKKIPYASIRSVAQSRSTFIDGIGIHWLPGRGWIWNIASGDCVEIVLTSGTLRLGTDDVTALHDFIAGKIAR